MKKVVSSQVSISINSCTEFSKTQFFPASIVNIFISDLFLSITKCEVCNFADDNTLYSCNKTKK